MKAGLAIAGIELLALAIGLALWHFGFVAGWTVPLFLIAPPAVGVVAVIASFASASRNGQNPFQ